MYGREELTIYAGDYYKKREADKVMDAMEARIKELESQLPKWISVKDRLPDEDGEYQVVYKTQNGAMVSTFDEWDNDYKGWCAAETSAVVYWAELLPPPSTTEESSAVVSNLETVVKYQSAKAGAVSYFNNWVKENNIKGDA